MRILTFYVPTEFEATWVKFNDILESNNLDGRKKHKDTVSKTVRQLIENYVKENEKKEPLPTSGGKTDIETKKEIKVEEVQV